MEQEVKLQTPSQTIGPYFAYGLTPEQYGYNFTSWVGGNIVDLAQRPDAITISGKVYDGAGNPIDDAMIELWINDGQNRLFGRFGTGTSPDCSFEFTTIKPASVQGQAPFINVILFMRGQLLHSYTRIYFPNEELNQSDDTLAALPEDRRNTLIAKKVNGNFVFDIHMQGEQETVFFQI